MISQPPISHQHEPTKQMPLRLSKPTLLMMALALAGCAQLSDAPASSIGPAASGTPAPTHTASAVPPTHTPTATAVPAEAVDASQVGWVPLVTGPSRPTFLTHAGDGSGRAFLVQQPGAIWILIDGQIQPEPFLDIRHLVGSTGNEQGLFSVAFHPEYERSGQFFVNYTDRNGDSVVARYSVSAHPDRADPDSAVTLLHVEQPYPNHNGGQMQFGPDGYLYIGFGDGGSGGDPEGNGQNLSRLLGKLLRIDVNSAEPHAIPPDNPFVGRTDVLEEIWAYGLRNPWRFSFDRATGDLFIADVGQNAYEEVNFQPADSPGGENYGWDIMEGAHPYEGGDTTGLVLPVAEYGRDEGCTIIGGYVYRGSTLPGLWGVYLYGDLCSGNVWGLSRGADGFWSNRLLFQTGFTITSFGEDEGGELYLLDIGGDVYRLERLGD